MENYFEERDRKREIVFTIYTLILLISSVVIPYLYITGSLEKGESLHEAIITYSAIDLMRSILALFIAVLIADEFDRKPERVTFSGVFNSLLFGIVFNTLILTLIFSFIAGVLFVMEYNRDNKDEIGRAHV